LPKPRHRFLDRPIPRSGERIPAVGLGTAHVFDENNEVTRSKADAVVQALVKSGRIDAL
jgi:aryl-alcohol dehydrogenase-like predicted oxidoreductase